MHMQELMEASCSSPSGNSALVLEDTETIEPKEASGTGKPFESYLEAIGFFHDKAKRTNKVFVGGLPGNLTEDEMKAFFETKGKVDAVSLMMDPVTKRHRGFGFVIFEDASVVDLLVEAHYITVNGKVVEIKKAKPRNEMFPELYGAPAPAGAGGALARQSAAPRNLSIADAKQKTSTIGKTLSESSDVSRSSSTSTNSSLHRPIPTYPTPAGSTQTSPMTVTSVLMPPMAHVVPPPAGWMQSGIPVSTQPAHNLQACAGQLQVPLTQSHVNTAQFMGRAPMPCPPTPPVVTSPSNGHFPLPPQASTNWGHTAAFTTSVAQSSLGLQLNPFPTGMPGAYSIPAQSVGPHTAHLPPQCSPFSPPVFSHMASSGTALSPFLPPAVQGMPQLSMYQPLTAFQIPPAEGRSSGPKLSVPSEEFQGQLTKTEDGITYFNPDMQQMLSPEECSYPTSEDSGEEVSAEHAHHANATAVTAAC
eukprot:scpid36180/ scgid16521/ RNA-binding protein Musashi homolog 2